MGKKARPILEDMLAYAEEARAILGDRDGAALRGDRIRLLASQEPWKLSAKQPISFHRMSQVSSPSISNPQSAMRHRLIHGYDSVSADIVAKTVQDNFPTFIVALRGILAAPLPDGS